MATPAVGEDIESVCGRCGPTWHVVMAKVGDKIAKVVCKRCGSHHSYRREDGSPAANAAAESKRGGIKRFRRRSGGGEEAMPVIMPDASGPPVPYAAKEVYSAGQRISHPSFGVGVVVGSPGPGKIEIVFPGGSRVLACAKAASTLQRPSFVDHVPISDRPPTSKE